MSYESKIYSLEALNVLNTHLYRLTSVANERLDIMFYQGCYFCGRKDPEVVKQFLYNKIYRIPVCRECDARGWAPDIEDLDNYG